MGSLHVNVSLGGRQLGLAALMMKCCCTLLRDGEAGVRWTKATSQVRTGVKRNDGDALRMVMKPSETQSLEQRDGAEAQSQEAGAQQVAQRSQVGDGEVVRVQAPPPHQADDEVGDIEKDGHLEGEGQLLFKGCQRASWSHRASSC